MIRIVAYVPDLMDRSKVAAAAPEATFCHAPAELVATAREQGAVLAVVDLSRDGVLDAVSELAATGVASVGFGSHVEGDLLERARRAGCDRVLTRAAFFRQTGEVLSRVR
jgi:hypothetical protein